MSQISTMAATSMILYYYTIPLILSTRLLIIVLVLVGNVNQVFAGRHYDCHLMKWCVYDNVIIVMEVL